MNKTEVNVAKKELSAAIRYVKEGRHGDAIPIFNRYTAEVLEDLDTRILFGDLCVKLENVETGISIFKALVDDYPDEPVHLGNLGWAYTEGHLYERAEKYLQRAVEGSPDNWSFVTNYAVTLLSLKKYDEAIEIVKKAIALDPGKPASYENLIAALKGAEQHELAIEEGLKAVRRYPKDSKIQSSLGLVYLELGQEDEAIACFERSIELNKLNADAYLFIASAKKFKDADMPLVKRIEKVLATGMAPLQRSYIHFALAKIYNDLKDYENAYSHLHKANTLKKVRHHELSIEPMRRLYEKVFTPQVIKTAQKAGHTSDRPIFVVGMPRSGTTLTEQIIGRHSQAKGVGELEKVGSLARKICPVVNEERYVRSWQEGISSGRIRDSAKEYLDLLDAIDSSPRKTVDKMPDNFLHMGFIHLMFPKAKFIHIVRDPLDNCLSCYFQCFQSIHWAFEQKSIGYRYLRYREIMDYWEAVLPSENILRVRYEDLVSDPEVGARKLINYCGLNWEEQCLDSNVKSSAVSTASIWQVRQPIYKSSIKRWHPYVEHLGELGKILLPYLAEEDIEFFESKGIKIRKNKWWPF